MTERMGELAAEIVRLQDELDREIEKRRKALGWELKEKVWESCTLDRSQVFGRLLFYRERAPDNLFLFSEALYKPLTISQALVNTKR